MHEPGRQQSFGPVSYTHLDVYKRQGQGFLTAFAGKIVSKGQNIRVRGASSSDPIEDLTGLIETDAHAQPGDSGGPVFDAQREVLGMTTAGSSDAGNNKTTAFAVPIADALGAVSYTHLDVYKRQFLNT